MASDVKRAHRYFSRVVLLFDFPSSVAPRVGVEPRKNVVVTGGGARSLGIPAVVDCASVSSCGCNTSRVMHQTPIPEHRPSKVGSSSHLPSKTRRLAKTSGVSVMSGLGSGAITPSVNPLSAGKDTLRRASFLLRCSRHAPPGPLRRADALRVESRQSTSLHRL